VAGDRHHGPAAWGFFSADVVVLLACTFLMGLALHAVRSGQVSPTCRSTWASASSRRQRHGGDGHLRRHPARAGGGWAAGDIPAVGPKVVGAACIALAIVGRPGGARHPGLAGQRPGLQINWNLVSETWRNLQLAHGNVVVFRSLLGISWMWFFGAVFLSQFPSFAKEVLHGNAQVASLLLVVFSVGIGIGSLLCELLSRRHVEIGLVPLGADRHDGLLGRPLLRFAGTAAVAEMGWAPSSASAATGA
jgi:uncharacterized membrane protein YciS (DUF1049 family)